MPLDEARRGAADRVRDLRYGKDGKDYFWITDMRPVMIVHPYRPELEGTDVSEYRDANGVQVFVEFLKAVRDRDQGYVEYLWQWKDDSHRIVPKLSFVERFPAWDWVIGTGIYLDDVQEEIGRMARWMIWLSLGITAALALILAFVTHQSLAIERGRQTAETRLRESHERYRALVEASGEGMVLLVGGAFAYANRTFLDMTGYSASQLPLVGLTELIHPHEGDEPALERFLAALGAGPAADAAGPPPIACRSRAGKGSPSTRFSRPPRSPSTAGAAGSWRRGTRESGTPPIRMPGHRPVPTRPWPKAHRSACSRQGGGAGRRSPRRIPPLDGCSASARTRGARSCSPGSGTPTPRTGCTPTSPPARR